MKILTPSRKLEDGEILGVKPGSPIVACVILMACVIWMIIIYHLLVQMITIAFDFIYGEQVVDQTLQSISTHPLYETDPAQAIMDWEQSHFRSPYSENKRSNIWSLESIAQIFSLVKINDSYQLFIRNAPYSWKIYAGLANCGEYSEIFVYLMNKSGVKARTVSVPAEDHSWAEYYNGSQKVVVETSGGYVISNTTKFAQEKNWSYIISRDLFDTSDILDVSDEYITRGNLTVRVFEDGNPINGAQVTILSPFLMQNIPSRYQEPFIVLSNPTNSNG
ncbi:MAG: transglutaminase domain-containing protein, partial [Candidatus Micrarchaeota archaeon]|nr:transglutaminase domain-containing protein [Candidatus Micrarchaeota archaeon]